MAATRSRPTQQTPTPAPPAPDAGPQLREIAVDAIVARISTRPVDPAHVESLALSIGERGLDTPITVYEASEGRYVLGAGRHRLEAHRLLGLPSIAALVRASPGDDEAIRLAQIAENLHRRDLLPIEEAEGVAALLEACRRPEYCRRHPDAARAPVEHVASVLARPVAWVRDRMYLDRLLPAVRQIARVGEIPAGHLRELARVGDADQQLALACRCIGMEWWTALERDEEDERTGELTADALEELRERIRDRTVARPKLSELRESIDRAMRPLRGVPWELELPVLALDGRELRPCAGCPHNSGSDRVLFAVAADAKHDVCADGSCYSAKREAADKARTRLQSDLARRKTAAKTEEVVAKAPTWMRTSTVKGIAKRHQQMVGAEKSGATRAASATAAAAAQNRNETTEVARAACRRFDSALDSYHKRLGERLLPLMPTLDRVLIGMLAATSDQRWDIEQWSSSPSVRRNDECCAGVDPIEVRADTLEAAERLAEIICRQGEGTDCFVDMGEGVAWDCLSMPIIEAIARRHGVELPPEPKWSEFQPGAEPAPKPAKKPKRGKAAAVKDQDDDGDEA